VVPVRPRRPTELTTGPFTLAAARASGVTPRMLRGATWRPLVRGVYADARLDLTDDLRLRALRLVLPPDAVAIDLTAAWLHGVWQPAPGREVPLHVATPRDRCRPPGPNPLSHRRHWWGPDVVVVRDVVATSPMRTAFELARRSCLVEAVVAVDAFAHAGLIDLPWFWAFVDAHRRWPGVRHVRAATELATDRARSAGESRLRMIPVLGGLPDPLVNAPVYRAGILIAILDLWLHAGERDVGIEYDGAYHEQSDQHRAENRRENALVGAGSFPLLRYDRFTVTRQAERLRALHQMGLAIGVEPASWLDPLWFADPRRPLRW